MARPSPHPSASSRALAAALLLPETTPLLRQAGVSRTDAWRYATGRVSPSAARAAALARVLGPLGVRADGWEPDAPQTQPATFPAGEPSPDASPSLASGGANPPDGGA